MGLNALAIEQESDTLRILATPFAKGIHELLELSRALDLEEDFVVVVCHFDVEMLGVLGFVLVVGAVWRSCCLRHCGD